MQKFSSILAMLVAVTLAGTACNLKAGDAGKGGSTQLQARKERILANLKAKFPIFEQVNPTLGDFKRKYGLEQVEMSWRGPDGERKLLFLVTPDDKELFLVMEEPLDVSLTKEQLAQAAEKKQTERGEKFSKMVSGLPARGNPAGAVTIIEFSDFQCPFCKKGAETMEKILAKYANDVKFYFVNFPLPFHQWAMPAAVAATCAAQQKPESFWALHDKLFANQKDITVDNLLKQCEAYLSSSGLDMAKWAACAKDEQSSEYKAAFEAVKTAMDVAGEHGVEGTPAFYINGEFLKGAVPFEQIESAIQKALNEKA